MDIKYKPVGYCIYCDERTLPPHTARFSDEHIIPLSLGGNLLLPEASCEQCARTINKEIETPVAHQEWGLVRKKHNLPTRNKKARREPATITLRKLDGSELQVPLTDYTAPVFVYKFGEARMLSGLSPGSDNQRWTVDILSNPDEETALQLKYPEWDKRHLLKAQPHQFARLLAKIAYAYCVAELGSEFFYPFVREIILGRSDDYYLTVGGTWDLLPAVEGGNHVTNINFIFVSATKARVIVDIRLFSSAEMPSYHVVVGEFDLKNPVHLARWTKHMGDGRIPSPSAAGT